VSVTRDVVESIDPVSFAGARFESNECASTSRPRFPGSHATRTLAPGQLSGHSFARRVTIFFSSRAHFESDFGEERSRLNGLVQRRRPARRASCESSKIVERTVAGSLVIIGSDQEKKSCNSAEKTF